jgi:phosphinothricin acetyltransferase
VTAIRAATADDVPAIAAIYDHVIATSDAIWEDEPEGLDARIAWFAAADAHPDHTVLVAEDGAGAVVGYASLGPFRTKSGYWPTAEHSVHVADGHRGQGIGQELLDAVVTEARRTGRHQLVAAIDGSNEGSIRFHQRNGFRIVGELAAVGRKWGRPVDLVLMQRDLDAGIDG